MKYIDADKLYKKVDELMAHYAKAEEEIENYDDVEIAIFYQGKRKMCSEILTLIDSIQQERMDEDLFELPETSIKDATTVTSRMRYIDDDLKPIAEFILDYASWNLHKNEWNHPVLEVPLFRVLDALAQRGKPYCCAG